MVLGHCRAAGELMAVPAGVLHMASGRLQLSAPVDLAAGAASVASSQSHSMEF